MALEIERRFLVRSDAWRSSAGPAQLLRQGYLAASADGVTVRMRLRGSDQAWLTLKAAADAVGLVRHEFEYPIPVADAEALWNLAPHRLDKVRYALDCPGGDWVVDCFQGENAPLVLAEVELASAQADLLIPPWCGEEITGESRWSNAVLAQHPVQSWPEEQRRRFDWPQGRTGFVFRFPLALKGSDWWVLPVVGLYDTTGMLRFAGSSVEACLEYATLFQIPVGPTSLQSLPEPVSSTIRLRGDRVLEGRNS